MASKGRAQKKEIYGIKSNGEVYLFNSASHPLHPWSSHQFVWGGLRFKRLEQCLNFFKADHFNLGREVKQKILTCQTGWDVVKVMKEQQIAKDADWSGWGKWTVSNLLPILRQMALESPRFRDELLTIQEPVIGLCTKDKSLGTGLAALPKKKEPELFQPNNWEGRNILGRELVQLRAELRILEEADEADKENIAPGQPLKRKTPMAVVIPLKRQLAQPEIDAGQLLPDGGDLPGRLIPSPPPPSLPCLSSMIIPALLIDVA